jgi:hypothetical protein
MDFGGSSWNYFSDSDCMVFIFSIGGEKYMVLNQVEIDRKAVLVARVSAGTITEAEKVELQTLKDKEAR